MKNKWNKRLHTPSLYLCTGQAFLMPHCPVTVVQRYRDGVCSLLFFIIFHPYIPLHLVEMIFYTCRIYIVHYCCDLHLNLKFAGRSITFRPKSFKPVPSGTALSKMQLQAPSSPVESRLTQQQRRSESEIAHQQSQLPTAPFLMSPTGKKALKQCKTYRSVLLSHSIFCLLR